MYLDHLDLLISLIEFILVVEYEASQQRFFFQIENNVFVLFWYAILIVDIISFVFRGGADNRIVIISTSYSVVAPIIELLLRETLVLSMDQ